MTMYRCHCGSVHDSAVQAPCPILIPTPPIPVSSMSPDDTGREIRRLLLALCDNSSNYTTDALRRRALEIAGICWLSPGEMAPMCCCDWSPEDPSGPAGMLESDQATSKKLWEALATNGCMVSLVSSRGCELGTRGCITKHFRK